MNKIKEMNKIVLYIICMTFIYLILMILNLTLNKKEEYVYKNYEYKKNNINEVTEIYEIDVFYPRFSNKDLSKVVTNYIYKYISDFKKDSEKLEIKQYLKIDYEIEEFEEYYNILFKINNSLKINDIYKSILVNIKENKEILISDVFGENILNEIKDLINKKYPKFIYNSVQNLDLKDYNYSFKDSHINIYVNKEYIKESIIYDVYVTKVLQEEKYVFEEIKTENLKYVAFTFDDGPSEYTKEVVDAFAANNSKATFFMLGNKMKAMPEVVQYVNEKGMEIGSHSYSHKNLTNISTDEMLEEINSVTILYKEIIGADIKLFRPPYGSVNNNVKNNLMFPIITWSIDPYDWLHKDTEFIKNHIYKTIYDGAIILMHDLYPTTIDAIKMLIPELNSQGYKLVSVSQLAEIKEKVLTPGEIIREIK